jgi:hypothetical protein
VLVAFHDVKSLAKDQITHNIVCDICAPVAHVLCRGPFSVPCPLSKVLTPFTNVLDDEGLSGSYGVVGEGMIKHTSSERMSLPVDLTMDTHGPCARVQGLVPCCLLNVGFPVSIDFFQCWNGVDRNGVGADANNGTYLSSVSRATDVLFNVLKTNHKSHVPSAVEGDDCQW